MASSNAADKLARGYAVLRGAMLVVVSMVLLVSPEKMLVGGVTESGRSLALMFGSRTLVLGIALAALAFKSQRRALCWVLFADAAFQVFDTGLAIASNKGALAALPALIGALDVWVGLTLLRIHAHFARQ